MIFEHLPGTHQNRIIYLLNKYFSDNNIPLKLNPGGVCHGLATVFAKYVAQGKQDEFFKILKQLSSKDPFKGDNPSQINMFITDVLRSFIPKQMGIPEYSQGNSMELIECPNANGQPDKLSSAYNFGTSTSDKNWVTIFNELKLQKGETIRVCSINHTVAITKEGENYIIYDPNYRKGFKSFSSAEEVVAELHQNVFHYKKGPMALALAVIRPPGSTPREFPDKSELMDKTFIYPNTARLTVLEKSSYGIHRKTHTRGALEASCTFAIPSEVSPSGPRIHTDIRKAISRTHNAINGKGNIKIHYIEQLILALDSAIFTNSHKAIPILGNELQQHWQNVHGDTIRGLFVKCLKEGYLNSYEQLKELEATHSQFRPCQVIYAQAQDNPRILLELIRATIKGQNPELFNKFCADFNELLTDNFFESNVKTLLSTAINAGNPQIFSEILQKMAPHLTEKEKIKLLRTLVDKNKPELVEALLDTTTDKGPIISQEVLASVRLSDRAVYKSHPRIIATLKNRDVNFDGQEQFMEKATKYSGIKIFGIPLKPFSDFLLRRKSLKQTTQAGMKQRLQQIRKAPHSGEEDVREDVDRAPDMNNAPK